eukprot:TRINITY_DN4026_c0_g1_i1.p1 TRINITY_DN4026_c0_g1~~TRINITY_DN4026_c0_g1_i1.p1  ORF type:complete len:219 (-),score=43.86 TRINITY_DN4026_c0_g1_i1:163-765(-)
MDLAKKMASSRSVNMVAARKKVIHLYRTCLKSIPEVRDKYALEDVPENAMRKTIRAEFEKSRGVTNTSVIDMLVFKGYSDLDEFLKIYKQKVHVFKYFTQFTNTQPAEVKQTREQLRVARNKWLIDKLKDSESRLEPVLTEAEQRLSKEDFQQLAVQLYKDEYLKIARSMPKLVPADFPELEGNFWKSFTEPTYTADQDW